MSLDPESFETLVRTFAPFRIGRGEFLNTHPTYFFHTKTLCYAFLDSPIQSNAADAAALFVPRGLENDWLFCTDQGLFQLLLSLPQFARLVLIGNNPISSVPTNCIQYNVDFEQNGTLETGVNHCVLSLCPLSPYVTILSYYDNVVQRKIVKLCKGGLAGLMLIEDVLIEDVNRNRREFRRRLRFDITPGLIQTQVPIRLRTVEDTSRMTPEDLLPLIDNGVLVQRNLIAMVSALSLISLYLGERMNLRFPIRALCLGVGGGSLLTFLNTKLGFQVVGVEEDASVLMLARKYFGLNVNRYLRLLVGDGMKLIEKLASLVEKPGIEVLDNYKEFKYGYLNKKVEGLDPKFDVIMVDLDPNCISVAVTAPPLEFVNDKVFLAAKSVLHEGGILVINVISSDPLFSVELRQEIRKVFPQLYVIDVGTGDSFIGTGNNFVGTEENSVLIACTSLRAASHPDPFLTRLKNVVSGPYMESIKKLEV